MNTPLHIVALCGILPTYLNYVKGGYSDTDGRTINRQGGSREVEVVGRGCEAIAEKREATWLHCSRLLAHQARGLESVLRATSQLHRRKVTLTSVSSTKIVIYECRVPKWQSYADATFVHYFTPMR